jgi:hypothetical protein
MWSGKKKITLKGRPHIPPKHHYIFTILQSNTPYQTPIFFTVLASRTSTFKQMRGYLNFGTWLMKIMSIIRTEIR